MRLKAWWEGYDTNDLKKRLADNTTAGAPSAALEPQPQEKKPISADHWGEEAVEIAQFIWGEGFCGPGGPDYIIALSKLLALSPEMSMLQIGAQLGGPARVLASRFGVWITGYDQSPTLVEKGNDLSRMAGLEKKATIAQYDPETIEHFERKFDRAISKEVLFTIKDKAGMIAKIEEKLKPGGLFLMTEYVLGSDSSVTKDSYKDWVIGERKKPYPVMADELVGMLKDNHLQVRVSEDISMKYVNMITKAWGGADEVAMKLAKSDDGSQKIQALMAEAEFWTRRKKLLESGDLKLWRIVANKKSSGPSGMSDW